MKAAIIVINSQESYILGLQLTQNLNYCIQQQESTMLIKQNPFNLNINKLIQNQYGDTQADEAETFNTTSLHCQSINSSNIYPPDHSLAKTHNRANTQTPASTTRQKLRSMRNSYTCDNSDIIYESRVEESIGSLQPSRFDLNGPKRKQIGYKLRDKINFKNQKNNLSQIQNPHVNRPQYFIERSFIIHSPGSKAITLKFNHHRNTSQSEQDMWLFTKLNQKVQVHSKVIDQNIQRKTATKGQIKASFRYCPSCQESILQANIQYHEESCISLQKLYQKPYREIKDTIQSKMKRQQGQIKQALIVSKQRKEIQYRGMEQGISLWLQSNDKNHYQQMQQMINGPTLDVYNKMHKLRWFRQLHDRVLQKTAEQDEKGWQQR